MTNHKPDNPGRTRRIRRRTRRTRRTVSHPTETRRKQQESREPEEQQFRIQQSREMQVQMPMQMSKQIHQIIVDTRYSTIPLDGTPFGERCRRVKAAGNVRAAAGGGGREIFPASEISTAARTRKMEVRGKWCPLEKAALENGPARTSTDRGTSNMEG